MRATLVGDESYDTPPRLESGVLVSISGVVHVCARNHGIRVKVFCHDDWVPFAKLEQGWFEFPTCVRCALNPMALTNRILELKWREEWWEREGNQLRTPLEVEPTL